MGLECHHRRLQMRWPLCHGGPPFPQVLGWLPASSAFPAKRPNGFGGSDQGSTQVLLDPCISLPTGLGEDFGTT